MLIKDQMNRKLFVPETPKRIVSLVPSLTELICDLGLESSLVGVTKFCVHPDHIRQKVAVVGGTKQVDVDQIKVLQPDIILCNKEENTLEMIQALVEVASVHLSDIYQIEDCLELIAMYGELFQIENRAKVLINEINQKYQQFQEYILTTDNTYKTVYFIWKEPWMIAAKDNFIDSMLNLNNYINYFTELKRYPEIDITNVYDEVELVFLSSEPYPFRKEHAKLLKETFPNAKIEFVNGECFSWYGSRLKQSFKYFKTLHQNLMKA